MTRFNMQDVAKHAGVSASTVSHVINNTRNVSDETRQKVLDSIHALNYSPDAAARSLKTGRRSLIGFIAPDISNPFFSTIIEEVENIINQNNYRLVITNTRESKERERESVRELAGGLTDGLIIASAMDKGEGLEFSLPSDFPIVLIDRLLPASPYDAITISSYVPLFQGISCLIEEGHRKIGFIGGSAHLSTTLERAQAYKDALSAHHIPIQGELMCFSDSMSQSALPCITKLIDHGCTALVLTNNVITDDGLLYLNAHHLLLNRDITIVGYDDRDRNGYNFQMFHTIRQPAKTLGRLAGQRIISRIQSPGQPTEHISLQAEFLKYTPRPFPR